MKTLVMVLFPLLAAGMVHAQETGAASLKDTLQWMHNFVAENGSQYTGQSSVDNQPCEVGSSPNCEQRHDVSTFDSQGRSAAVKWSITLNYKDLGTLTYRFSLKDLDPKSVTWAKDMPFENAAHTETTNSEKKVARTFTAPDGKTTEEGD